MNEIAFRALVRQTLDAQQVYFKSRLQSDLIKAKGLEQQIRKELAAGPDVVIEGTIEMTNDEGDQINLFGE